MQRGDEKPFEVPLNTAGRPAGYPLSSVEVLSTTRRNGGNRRASVVSAAANRAGSRVVYLFTQ
jgi:hypothetical protein